MVIQFNNYIVEYKMALDGEILQRVREIEEAKDQDGQTQILATGHEFRSRMDKEVALGMIADLSETIGLIKLNEGPSGPVVADMDLMRKQIEKHRKKKGTG